MEIHRPGDILFLVRKNDTRTDRACKRGCIPQDRCAGCIQDDNAGPAPAQLLGAVLDFTVFDKDGRAVFPAQVSEQAVEGQRALFQRADGQDELREKKHPEQAAPHQDHEIDHQGQQSDLRTVNPVGEGRVNNQAKHQDQNGLGSWTAVEWRGAIHEIDCNQKNRIRQTCEVSFTSLPIR